MNDKVYSKIKKSLSSLTIKDIIHIEENDPQFKALKRMYSHYGTNKVLFIKLVVINALLSYQLPMKGEKYWESFANYFSHNKNINSFPEFLKKNNYRLFNAKLKRFKKAREAVNEIFKTEKDLKNAINNIGEFLNRLSYLLNQKKDAKTVVFAIKMFIYACRIMYNKNIIAPKGIFIPMDSRIKSISDDKNFWKKLEKETKIPLIHIDAILWLSHEKWRK
ncbi:N-glycosylase/DNA lyase [Desulfurobacterium indicum]|uniref:DNA-(Apurinic or apyrimidinic site) lyase n=1 Tax=Desulfurobacterium indicum TaxID=1914305 RepID=A0A1R1MKZ3_9BACT|nr:N-glycosylase/DNA lyase [Desulfurobacterium indicum]OMH40436.1 hypothetical protein BLW93_05075 [Desulfurobacterium indicum]